LPINLFFKIGEEIEISASKFAIDVDILPKTNLHWFQRFNSSLMKCLHSFSITSSCLFYEWHTKIYKNTKIQMKSFQIFERKHSGTLQFNGSRESYLTICAAVRRSVSCQESGSFVCYIIFSIYTFIIIYERHFFRLNNFLLHFISIYFPSLSSFPPSVSWLLILRIDFPFSSTLIHTL
jgi:hypothetical protein